MSSCPEDPRRASKILFAEPCIHHPLGFGLETQVLRKLGWAVPQTANPDGLAVFSIKNIL